MLSSVLFLLCSCLYSYNCKHII
ncbi:SWIM zinc finger family protein [Ornithinibacillus halotolerans]